MNADELAGRVGKHWAGQILAAVMENNTRALLGMATNMPKDIFDTLTSMTCRNCKKIAEYNEIDFMAVIGSTTDVAARMTGKLLRQLDDERSRDCLGMLVSWAITEAAEYVDARS